MSSFFSLVAISIIAILIGVGILFAIRIARHRGRLGRELRRRQSGSQHRLGRPFHPPGAQAQPPVNLRDSWQPSASESDGRAGPELGYQDQVAKNAERGKTS